MINYLINKIILADFNRDLESETIELIKEANVALASGELNEIEMDSLLSVMRDFSSVKNFKNMIPMIGMKQDELFVEYDNYRINTFQKQFIDSLVKKGLKSISCPTSFGKSFLVRLVIKSIIAQYLNRRDVALQRLEDK